MRLDDAGRRGARRVGRRWKAVESGEPQRRPKVRKSNALKCVAKDDSIEEMNERTPEEERITLAGRDHFLVGLREGEINLSITMAINRI